MAFFTISLSAGHAETPQVPQHASGPTYEMASGQAATGHGVTHSALNEGLVPDAVERAALEALFNSTNGAGWSNSTNWLQGTTSSDFATWHGVTVAGGDVVRLELGGNGLSGTIPPELANLQALQRLHLYSNSLSGLIPAELGSLPSLQQLYLNVNALTGPIPSELGNLAALQQLFLYNNLLSGPVPASLGQLSALRRLELNGNELTGPLPAGVTGMVGLTHLRLHRNALTWVPDLSQHPNRAQLAVTLHGNQLDFGPVEANLTGPGQHPFLSLQYEPQGRLAAPAEVSVAEGQPLSLSVAVGGTRNAYQWQRLVSGTWQSIAGATQAGYTVAVAAAADAGAYRLEVTNAWAIDLVLQSATITVTVTEGTAEPGGGFVKLPPNLPVSGQCQD